MSRRRVGSYHRTLDWLSQVPRIVSNPLNRASMDLRPVDWVAEFGAFSPSSTIQHGCPSACLDASIERPPKHWQGDGMQLHKRHAMRLVVSPALCWKQSNDDFVSELSVSFLHRYRGPWDQTTFQSSRASDTIGNWLRKVLSIPVVIGR